MAVAIITRKQELKKYLKEIKKSGKSIGFVPTMGALHAGHGSLIEYSAKKNDCTVVSIFVNPLQFNANEDLSKYPRTFQSDVELCEKSGAVVLFAPTAEEMYPKNFCTEVKVSKITNFLCGTYRLGHFEGVATVVLLLVNLTQPDVLYLGQKDFQQVQVVKRCFENLHVPCVVEMLPTVREEDGLALSSRNRFLDPDARKIASTVPKALALVAKGFLNGEKNTEKLLEICLTELNKKNLTPQYLEIREAANLENLIKTEINQEAVLAIAQFIENNGVKTRLIDNILLGNDSAQIDALQELVSKASD